jgi:outer membrane protein assembly factor BamB
VDKVNGIVGGRRFLAVVGAVGAIGILGLFGSAACVQQSDPGATVEAQRALTGFTGVLTQHNDLGRTGANLSEVILTTSNVAKGTFGKLKSLPVDGQIYGQPLYVPALVNAQNVVQNVVFVATEKNKVYAFNADTFAPIWERDLESAWNPASSSCGNSVAPYGINSTPVIDPATSTMYVAVRTLTGGTPQHLLHALNLATGAEKQNGPLDMGLGLTGTGHLTVPGSGIGSTAGTGGAGGSTLAFDPLIHQNRVALTLSANHVLSVGFGSYCDHDNFHGWLLRFDVSSPTIITRLTPFVTTPNTSRGSLWMGGAGFADDGTGALYFMSGNGPLTTAPQVADTSGTSLGNAFVKLTGTTTPGTAPVVASWFMPSDVTTLDNKDTDVGSSGPLLIPGTSLILGGGKGGILYLLNKDIMGGFKAGTPLNSQIVQSFPASSGQWIVGSPVFWNRPNAGAMYIWPGKTPLEQYTFDALAGKFTTTSVASPITSTVNPPDDPQGGNLAISANGSTAGILWATHALSLNAGGGGAVPGALYAFDANNVATELWDSNMVAGDALASYAKYTVPTIANGKVYVSTFSGEVDVYGLTATTRDAGVVDAARDAPPAILTCATVDGGAAQPTTWSYVYNTYFAGTGSGDGGPVTLGHCAKCHDVNGSGHGFFASGDDKDSFYSGLLAIHQINADAGASSNISVPDASPLAWFGARATSGNIFALMPQDYLPSQVPNPRAIAAVCGWVKAGAVNDVVCTSPQVSCNNQCFDLTSSNAHCGSCAVTCTTGTSCLSGVCCATGSVNCSGTCAATATDVNNCGGCAIKCTAPTGGTTSCAASVCKPACTSGTLCGSACIATASDVNNCGACGTKCTPPTGGTTSCALSVCKPACTSGTLCGSACIATASDVNNCGACGVTCAIGASCTAGVCSAAACTTTNALIDDFEDGNNQIAALEGRNGADYTYADITGSTITPTAGSTFVPVTPGNGTSTRAAHFNGMLSGATTVWAGMGMDLLAPKGLYNASKYTGISFFAKKGSTTANGAVRVKIPDRNTDPTGAICTSCSNDFGVDLTLTTAWTKYTIPFSTMAQQAGWGAPRPAKIDPTGVVAVQFQVGATGQLYDIWVDDVTFTCN